MAKEKKLFVGGGLDTDTEERLVQPTDYRHALNVHIGSSDEDTSGAVENVLGNRRMGIHDLPAFEDFIAGDSYVCIGSVEDKSRNAIFYFVFNEDPNLHAIYYREGNNAFIPLIQDSILNFQRDI